MNESLQASQANNPSYISRLIDQFGNPQKVIEALVKKTNENPVDARLDLQVFLNALGREEESYSVSKQLVEIAPKDPRALFNHGWHLLKRGDLQKGMALLEYGRPLKTYGNDALASGCPLWTKETGRGQRVILALEGGFGDEIIHFRFGKDLTERYGCKVMLVCSPGIASLFSRQSWVAGLAQREAAPGIYHESWLPGMSAALALGYQYEDLSGAPYLSADEGHIRKWASLIRSSAGGESRKLKVGIRWAGRPQFEQQQLRLFPPEMLTDLSRNRGVQLYSFQRDDNLLALPEEIADLGPHLQTWDDTAAALSQMDLVISSCTSVAHLSAAMGKPTWIIVPALPYFTWATPGPKSPWYDSVTLFRQSQYGEWQSVREELQQSFAETLNQRSA